MLRRRLLASCDYELLPPRGTGVAGIEIPPGAAAPSGWASKRTAARQDRAWTRITKAALAGDARADVRAAMDAIDTYASDGATLLEVGCGSGYFSEVIAQFHPELEYIGIDNSQEMISLARNRRPGVDFRQEDATALAWHDNEIDITVDGAALIHIPDWRRALTEYDRVTRGPMILNSLTICELSETRYVRKLAYGASVVESVFSRSELSAAIEATGRNVLSQVPTLPYNLQRFVGIETTSELWVAA